MSYVKTTGTNIGNCLTGFGIHYPITIYNSGNAAVLYSVENSNSDNFSLSKNNFTINAGDYDIFDIFYRPTLSNSLGDEITDLIQEPMGDGIESVHQVLVKGLVELCKVKPVGPEAVKFLGEWLLVNNPNKPSVNEPLDD